MKKRYIIAFSAIAAINAVFRFIIPEDISHARAAFITAFTVILPFAYAFSAFHFAKLSWKTVGIVTAALLASSGIMVLFGNGDAPLSELVWIFMQIPAMIFSFIAGYFTFSTKTKNKKIKTFASFIPPLILSVIFIYSFCSIMISWSNSIM